MTSPPRSVAAKLRTRLERPAEPEVLERGVFDRADAEGFVGLVLEMVAQLLVLDTLCRFVVRLPDSIVLHRILPGVGLALLVANLVAAWTARREASEGGIVRPLAVDLDVPAIFLVCFLVMFPARLLTKSGVMAWELGLVAAAVVGVVYNLSALVPASVRSSLAGAATLSPLAALCFLFLALPAVLGVSGLGGLGMMVLAVLALAWLVRAGMVEAVPVGLLVLVVGGAAAWVVMLTGGPDAAVRGGLHAPRWSLNYLVEGLRSRGATNALLLGPVIGLFAVASALRTRWDAREAAPVPDVLPTVTTLGMGTLLGAALGSCFPLSLAAGFEERAELGSRGRFLAPAVAVIVALCVTGGLAVTTRMLPPEAALALVVWIGLVVSVRGLGLGEGAER